VALEVATAHSYLGALDHAQRHWNQAKAVLAPLGDPIHNLLLAWYEVRIARAVENMPVHQGVEAELERRRLELDPYQRFKVDRLRQRSRLLEPDGVLLDPVWMFRHREEAFAAVVAGAEALADPAALHVALKALVADVAAIHRDAAIRTAIFLCRRLSSPAALLATLADVVLDRVEQDQLRLAVHLARLARRPGQATITHRLAGHLETRLGGDRPEAVGAAVRETALALAQRQLLFRSDDN